MAQSVPRTAIRGQLTVLMRSVNVLSVSTARGSSNVFDLGTGGRGRRHELRIVVQELVEAIDDVHSEADGLQQQDALTRRQRAAHGCDSEDVGPGDPTGMGKGVCQVATDGHPVWRAAQYGARVASRAPAVDDREDFEALGVTHESVGRFSVHRIKVRLAVHDRCLMRPAAQTGGRTSHRLYWRAGGALRPCMATVPTSFTWDSGGGAGATLTGRYCGRPLWWTSDVDQHASCYDGLDGGRPGLQTASWVTAVAVSIKMIHHGINLIEVAVRSEDLHHDELLELDSAGGVIRFGGQRALVVDAVAMGLLRQYLVENFGLTAARSVLTQFGFAHGWRMAAAMREAFEWANDAEWRRAGPRICTLEGLFLSEPGSDDPLQKEGATLLASYEAEQHLLHFGRSDSTVCWTVCGLVSGYLSHTAGEEIYVLEDRCLGRGEAACRLLGRTREAWGNEYAEALTFFSQKRLDECLDVSLGRVMKTLKAAEAKLQAHRRALVQVVPEVEQPLGIVAKSPSMQRVSQLARRVARVDATLLITGESGVGKERVARLVHRQSPRAAGPFIAVNCGAISETLLESELFGHARGAFTGAVSDRPGLFEAANRGTLLLDEIGDVPPAMQVKLLRVLQEREVRRVGENKSRRVDVRVLAATNRDLAQEVAGGSFRQDLYYRLKVVELSVPPLRERREDILPLARLLLADAALRMSREISSLTPRVVDQLLRYRWPGNVRELENAMERAVALATGSRVEVEDLPEEVREAVRQPLVSGSATQPLSEVEKEYILAVLERNGGNRTVSAKQLGIGSATLYRKLKAYGVTNA